MTSDKQAGGNPGLIFKQTREKLGLSINDVSVSTKINPRILRALEEGDKKSLPPHSFARGFIRSYASYLKIDSKPVLEAFDLQDHSANPNINTNTSVPSETESTKNPAMEILAEMLTGSKILLVSGLLVITGLIFGVKRVIDKYERERVLPGAHQQADSEPSVKQPESSASAPATSESSLTQLQKATSEELKKIETKPAETKLVEKVAPPAATPPTDATTTADITKTSAAKSPAPATTTAPTTAPTSTSSATSAPKPPAQQEVLIEALDSVEITVEIDGKTEKTIRMTPESAQAIKANSSIKLHIKDGGMVNITYNGTDRGVPGDLGKPIDLKYP